MLIAVGVVWLLANVRAVSTAQLSTLMRPWPILLVGVGADLLIGHRSLYLGALVGFGHRRYHCGVDAAGAFIGLGRGYYREESDVFRTWETPGYESATHKIAISVENVSSGSVIVKQGGSW